MASSSTSSAFALALPPAHLLLFQLIGASAAVGCPSPESWVRPAVLPILSACSYGIMKNGNAYMRPRWASLLGGFSVAVLLRYLDVGVINRWNFESQGPVGTKKAAHENTEGHSSTLRSSPSTDTFFNRMRYGWYTIWSFRQVNTPYEVRNVPRFSDFDPNYVPSRATFVLRQAASAIICYLLLDLLSQRPPPTDLSRFDPALIPLFSRLPSVTAAELRLRALTITGFAVTFFLIIQGAQSFAAALSVATGVSPVRNWRPAFGSIWDAYSLKNVWGYFWHQLLRQSLSAPAKFLVHNILNLPRHSSLSGVIIIFSSFALSGVLHTAAGVSSGMPISQLGVFRFFCTQACGLILEQSIVSLFRYSFKQTASASDQRGNKNESPHWHVRLVGYAWVMAFMVWTGPSWIYPQAARAPAQGATSILPFSIFKWMNR
ncbi:hypothetical protein DM02DRAFT_691959 [Periconia macrospinosa]|uniref:Wax synthase domain-containing protein n=1 Tax=Periconia macrospinosa TaxID=97972 RepID=A0A2V1D9Z6_9PLEO|nr:hypothetical protein DM02DRAFT_691959 [Periconia macrospinosa]